MQGKEWDIAELLELEIFGFCTNMKTSLLKKSKHFLPFIQNMLHRIQKP